MEEIWLKSEMIKAQLPADLIFSFDTIHLEGMSDVKLFNRYDSKFCLKISLLANILESVKNDYYILEIKGARIQKYRSVYFDTLENRFYLDHHNGFANRIKLRKREYTDSDLAYLEIKQKDNKGKTSKKRMKIDRFSKILSEDELRFISDNTPLRDEEFVATFSNRFRRITLVNKNFKERCTIDLRLEFNALLSGESKIEDMVVIELKQAELNLKTKLSEELKRNKIYECGFSKYCMGRALNEKELKANRFKPGILNIKKIYSYQEI